MTVSENTSRGAIELHQGFCILMNIYRIFTFSTLHSVSQHVTLQQIISNVSSLHMTQLAGKETNNFQQVLKLIELKSIFTTCSPTPHFAQTFLNKQ